MIGIKEKTLRRAELIRSFLTFTNRSLEQKNARSYNNLKERYE